MSENRKLLEMNVPMWFDGKSINEALLCEDFLRTRQIIFEILCREQHSPQNQQHH